jgi:hypothetical protein
MQSKGEPSRMAGQKEKVAKRARYLKRELRIEESTGSSGTIVKLQGLSAAIAPRVDEKIELKSR